MNYCILQSCVKTCYRASPREQMASRKRVLIFQVPKCNHPRRCLRSTVRVQAERLVGGTGAPGGLIRAHIHTRGRKAGSQVLRWSKWLRCKRKSEAKTATGGKASRSPEWKSLRKPLRRTEYQTILTFSKFPALNAQDKTRRGSPL